MLAVIIHNEPTSYPALHENGLPQAFLKMVSSHIPPTPELITAIPNVFDAICINNQGKELFAQYNFDGFFSVFRSLEHCKIMTKGHCASDAGAAMDELLRHHPDLKDVFLKGYIQMVTDVCQNRIMNEEPVGVKLPELADVREDVKNEKEAIWIPCALISGQDQTRARIEEERNTPVLLLARNMLYFSEGFFSTAHWLKDFVKDDGHKLLLGILNAPALPCDYAETRDGFCLRNLICLFAEQNGPIVIPHIINATRDILTQIDQSPACLPNRYITDDGLEELDLATINPYLRLLARLLSHLGVLHSIYTQTTNLQGRPNTPYTLPFNQPENVEMIGTLGKIVRDCYSRGNELMRLLPKKYKDALSMENIENPNTRRRSDKSDLTDDAFMNKHGFPRRSPIFRNIELFQLLIGLLPRRTQRFFAGLSNSLVSRTKLNDPNQRTVAVSVLDKMSDVFLDLIRYNADQGVQTLDQSLYIFCATTFIHNTLIGGIP